MQKLEQDLLNQYSLNKVIPYFREILDRLSYRIDKTETVLIFGSSLWKNSPSDIDYFVVSSDKSINPDCWSAGWRIDGEKPPLEFNGSIEPNLDINTMMDPWFQPANELARDIFRALKLDKPLIIVTLESLAEKYQKEFAKALITT